MPRTSLKSNNLITSAYLLLMFQFKEQVTLTELLINALNIDKNKTKLRISSSCKLKVWLTMLFFSDDIWGVPFVLYFIEVSARKGFYNCQQPWKLDTYIHWLYSSVEVFSYRANCGHYNIIVHTLSCISSYNYHITIRKSQNIPAVLEKQYSAWSIFVSS